MAERHDTLVMLRLREITITDLGNYTCEAENTQGTARDHIELSGKHLLKIFSQFLLILLCKNIVPFYLLKSLCGDCLGLGEGKFEIK